MKVHQLLEKQDEFEEIFTIDSVDSWKEERGNWIFHSPLRLKAVYNGYDQVTIHELTQVERIIRRADRKALKLGTGSYMFQVEDILAIDKFVDDLMPWFKEEWSIDEDNKHWPWYFIVYSKGDL